MGTNIVNIEIVLIWRSCFKQHLSNIWSLIHEKWSNTETELKKASVIEKNCVKHNSHLFFSEYVLKAFKQPFNTFI